MEKKTTQEKLQGNLVRLFNLLPGFMQTNFAKKMGYPVEYYPELDPFLKLMFGLQMKNNVPDFISGTLEDTRKNFAQNAKVFSFKSTQVKVVKDYLITAVQGTVNSRFYSNDLSTAKPLMIFFHGGGFVTGDLDSHDEFCRLVVKHSVFNVISVEYGLWPEVHPSLSLEQCENSIRWIKENSELFNVLNGEFVLCGDSAGGSISLSLSQMKLDSIKLKAMLLIYPSVDCDGQYASNERFSKYLYLKNSDLETIKKLYLDIHSIDHKHPSVSPIYGDLTRTPPTLVTVAGHDILNDHGVVLFNKLNKLRIKTEFMGIESQAHGFINFTQVSTDALNATVKVINAFDRFYKSI